VHRVPANDEVRVVRADDPLAEPRSHEAGERVSVEADGERMCPRLDPDGSRELNGRERSQPGAVELDRHRCGDVGPHFGGRPPRRGVTDRRPHMRERRLQ